MPRTSQISACLPIAGIVPGRAGAYASPAYDCPVARHAEPVAASVLEAPPPRFTPDEIARIAAGRFGLDGAVTDLGSERDQTFLVDDGRGGGAVLKISNLGESEDVLDLETEAILHVSRVDPGLPIARPRRIGDGYRTTIDGPDGTHFVRLFERVHGRAFAGPDLDDGAVFDYAAVHARLNLALRSFFHPAAGRVLLWDLRHASRLRASLGSIADPGRRALLERVLERFELNVRPRWARLRAHVVHGDLNLDNVLFDDRGRIAGIVDFGDLSHTAEVADLAIGLASLLRGRSGEDVFRAARIAIDGYESRVPLEDDEHAVLADLVATRLAAIVIISAWRVGRYPENAGYIQAWDADSWALLELLDAMGADVLARELGPAAGAGDSAELARRRGHALGAALTGLTYRRPVHVVSGRGVWLLDSDGNRLLDAYNNVPVVGHCHPRVTEAVVRQTRTINTHSRYLYEPLVELAERLAASMPAGSGLDTVMLVNSGSEANDLAWRIATTVTGRRGTLVTRFAYHGVTTAITDMSPEEWPYGYDPPHVARIDPRAPVEDELGRALERIAHGGVGLAATYLDTGFTSDGILRPDDAALAAILAATHAAGGLVVADEVQAGHGRTGEGLWSFARYGITPDLVTLGKPMGNGYPVAAVIARAAIVDAFAASTHFFSTFGGNPVASQAALAVLDVIEDERLVEHAGRVGAYLGSELRGLAAEQPAIAAVRGSGLLVGIELVSVDGSPDAALAERVVEAMREGGVLIGRTGPGENVLKIRPPLPFAERHADILLAALRVALEQDRCC
jgi:4-aminobutyrate aminotransferase-like enzyme/Ser/Thr protein kinase RdoA (MazF antagonist)